MSVKAENGCLVIRAEI
ncbi:hypothetical protein [Yersinia intermedia]